MLEKMHIYTFCYDAIDFYETIIPYQKAESNKKHEKRQHFPQNIHTFSQNMLKAAKMRWWQTRNFAVDKMHK